MRSFFSCMGVRSANLHVSRERHFFGRYLRAGQKIKCRKTLSIKLQAMAMSRQVCLPYVQLDNCKQCHHPPTTITSNIITVIIINHHHHHYHMHTYTIHAHTHHTHHTHERRTDPHTHTNHTNHVHQCASERESE